ncbi:MAG: alpha/beta hydrolase fold domain-containing protein, partial [Nevskiales bacterium]
VNYRMQSSITPLQQAEDIARALAAAQGKAASWGADPAKFILMGHSAGAHLVALLAAAPQQVRKFGAAPWLGTVALDSAALDVPQIMNARHPGLYDRAFGSNAASWPAMSPYHQLAAGVMPVLAVCSSQRSDSCAQASRFVARAVSLGVRAESLPRPLSHGEINQQLGLESGYTAAVEAFMGSLDTEVRDALKAR